MNTLMKMSLLFGYVHLDTGGEIMDLDKFIHKNLIYSKCSEELKKEIDKELDNIKELKKENEILLKRIAELEDQRWSQ